jgi:hypothetical protein
MLLTDKVLREVGCVMVAVVDLLTGNAMLVPNHKLRRALRWVVDIEAEQVVFNCSLPPGHGERFLFTA